jgi:HEPN pEK499 p136
MRYEELVRDFAQRTISNLNIIEREQKSGNNDAYEVTQAVSSLLGLIVFPAENKLQDVMRILNTFKEYQILQDEINSDADYKSYTGGKSYSFIDLMRNAISHCNIRMVNSGRDLSSVVFWNCPNSPYKEEQANWKISIKAESIFKLCHLIASAINEYYLSTTGGNQ